MNYQLDMNETKRKNTQSWIVIGCFFVMGLLLLYQSYRNDRENELLERSKSCTAVLTEIINGSGVRSSPLGTYTYVLNGKTYSYTEGENFNNLKVGDTILIEYAIADHSVARVVDKYYMKKYAYLKKIEK
jgi:hypothetical protein